MFDKGIPLSNKRTCVGGLVCCERCRVMYFEKIRLVIGVVEGGGGLK